MRRALEERRRQQRSAQRVASEYVRRVREQLGPLTGVLYGSFARGDFNLGSDIDVLIVCDSLPINPLARSELLYRFVRGGIEPKGYTTAEFARMLASNNATAVDACEHGITLWHEGLLSAAMRLASRSAANRGRVHTGQDRGRPRWHPGALPKHR